MSQTGNDTETSGLPRDSSALEVDLAGCCACRCCEVACSFHLTGAYNPAASAILISFDGRTGNVGVRFTDACDLCRTEPAGPLCIAHCPLDVIQLKP